LRYFDVGDIPEFNRKRRDQAIVNGYFAVKFGPVEEDSWKAIDISEATETIVELLRFGPNFSEEWLSWDDAKSLTSQIFDLFPDGTRFYSTSFGIFDSVITFITDNQVGIFWV
jgi:hypothetical protein